MKPYLAEAVRGFPYFLLYQAQENICPLNNLRLLATGPDKVEQCPRNQLATPEICCRCLAERGRHSGALHQAERELAGVGTREYDQKLRSSLARAVAVLALNPIIAAMLEPYSSRVCIVPWGMAPARFPWPVQSGRPAPDPAGQTSDGDAGATLTQIKKQRLRNDSEGTERLVQGTRVHAFGCRGAVRSHQLGGFSDWSDGRWARAHAARVRHRRSRLEATIAALAQNVQGLSTRINSPRLPASKPLKRTGGSPQVKKYGGRFG